jgi:hypothetical protein
MRRKGELSPSEINKGWPHQVAVPEKTSVGPGYKITHDFCKELSLCPRGHSFKRDREWWSVFCFAEKADAEKFKERFGGEWFEARKQGRAR